MPLVLITPPAAEPLTYAEAAGHLRVETPTDETYITSLVVAARQWAERYLGRALVTQTWERVLDRFPCGAIVLGMGRLASVTSVTYLDAAGASQTLGTSAYQVDDVSEPGRVLQAPSTYWPSTEAGRVNAVRVRFVAGYGAASAVPVPIKAAMLLLVGHLYEHRESEVTGTITSEHKLAIDALLSPYVIHGFGYAGESPGR